jgi:phosphoribosylformimino-5-aminoimidazole carboxamide ribotide isomerase
MEVVPVIDLKGGTVVRARLGDRAAYRPIETPLSPTSDPLDVVAGLISVHPFRTLYVADLDAIEGKGDAGAVLVSISETFPELALWVDNGCSELSAAQDFLARFRRPPVPPPPSPPPTSLVLGSESQRDCGLLRALRDHPHVILSLDFRGDRFLGPDCLLSEPDLWPQRLIVMTLARVGSGAGPDLDRHAAIGERAGGRLIYLAGGLRDRRDLAAVKASGAAGILVASALHDGRISAADLTSA